MSVENENEIVFRMLFGNTPETFECKITDAFHFIKSKHPGVNSYQHKRFLWR